MADPPRYARKLGHIGITVPDLDRAVEWYQDVLGFELLAAPITIEADASHAGRNAADVFGPRFGRMRQAHLTTANGVGVELFEFDVPGTQRPADNFAYWQTGIFHLCVVDRDIDGLVDRIDQSGGAVRTRPVRDVFPDMPYRWCYCEDPFGNIIEVYSHGHEEVYVARRSVPRAELEYLLQFEHPEKLVMAFPGGETVGDSWVAEVYGVEPADIRSLRLRWRDAVEHAARELLRDERVAETLVGCPFESGDVVVALGDSITDDYQSWAYLLEALFRIAGRDVTVVNMGFSGATTQDLIVRVGSVVATQPDWIVTLVGTNDAALLWRSDACLVSHGQTEANLSSLRAAMLAHTQARLVWMTPPPVAADQLRRHFMASRDPLEVSSLEIEQKADLVRSLPDAVVDLHLVFPSPPDALLVDGVHPNLAGQQAITRALLERLARTVAD